VKKTARHGTIFRNVREHEVNVDHFSVKKLPVEKFAAAILKLPDHCVPKEPSSLVAK
jgi:hypothetical protein